MSCILTNLSDSQEDTLCSSPPCVCSLPHFPLYCFMSLYRIWNASVHLGPFGCVQNKVFLSHTPTHTELDPGAAPICAFYSFSVNSASHFPTFSPLFFSVFLLMAPRREQTWRKKMTKTQRQKKKSQESAGWDCRLGALSMMALLQSRERKCLSSTDSVRRGSVWI